LQDFFRDLANAQRDAVAVDRAEGDDLEDEHVKSALEQIGFLDGHLERSPRQSTYTAVIGRLSRREAGESPGAPNVRPFVRGILCYNLRVRPERLADQDYVED
jgi:hypothetical protein